MKKIVILLAVVFSLTMFGCVTPNQLIRNGMENISNDFAISNPPNADKIAQAQSMGMPIAVSAVRGKRNSANGIDVSSTWKNISDRQIKYCYMVVELINRVGDVVADEVHGREDVVLEYTGPFNPGQVYWAGNGKFPAATYHTNATNLRIKSLWVIWMDDNTESAHFEVSSLQGMTGKISEKYYR